MPHRRTCAIAGLALASIASGSAASRRFTVRDAIEMSSFAPNFEISAAPDGKTFFAVTQRGIIASDELESKIWLFRPGAEPRALVRMGSLSNGDAITNAQWGDQGRNILFIGRSGNSGRRLYTVQIKNSALRQLSPDDQDVTGFLQDRGKLVYTTAAKVDPIELYQSGGSGMADIEPGSGRSIFGFLYPYWEEVTSLAGLQQVWQVSRSKPERIGESDLSSGGRATGPLLSLSPNGRYAVAARLAEPIEAAWRNYESGVAGRPTPQFSSAGRAHSKGLQIPEQYLLIDLKTHRMFALLNAPVGALYSYYDPLRVAWTPDENRVAVSNSFLPIDPAAGMPALKRACVAVVEPASGKFECVKQSSPVDPNETAKAERLAGLEWRGEELGLHYSNRTDWYRRTGQEWTIAQTEKLNQEKAKPGPAEVREDLNEPPVLIAGDAANGRSREIWNPNPDLKNVELGDAALYRWKDPAGHEWTGALVKPPDFEPGQRYPLVIQTHGLNQKQFLAEGIFSTAMAARPMAAHGMLVLQVQEIRTDAFLTPREPRENGCTGYLSAIDQLLKEGLVDSGKVGLIGFSRTGWYVLDCLTNFPDRFAAATLAEATYLSMGEYLLNADYRGPQRAQSIADGIGSQPFGEGLEKWLKTSPGFKTGRITAAVLFEANNPPGLIYSWDLYAAMRLQSKPVDYLFIRTGEHALKKPRQRLASQEMTVDWYRFWLKGEEDPDAAKADQFARWRGLRDLTKSRR